MKPLLSVRNVSKSFGPTQALRDVGFDVTRGRTRALLGRNGAGKSTLVSILTGVHAADAGSLTFDGEPAPPPGDGGGWRQVVACVYQRSMVVPSLTVAENLHLGRQPRRGARIDWRRLYADAADVLDLWSIPVDPRTRIAELSVGDRQMVEIARALSTGCRFMILDEPTAKLDAQEIERLFEKMRQLQLGGITFLYISHHLQEIFQVCQDVTVLRDGRNAGEGAVDDLTEDDIVAMMTGGAAPASHKSARRSPVEPASAPERLRLDKLGSTKATEPFHDVDLTVRAGEIVGIAGIDGSGKMGVAEVVVGLAKGTEGTVTSGETRYSATTVTKAIAGGIGFVPQDRQQSGIVPRMSVAENVTLTGTPTTPRTGFASPRTKFEAARRTVADLDIKIGDLRDPISSLSGGNQQKVLLGRALQTAPRTLVLMAPTAGVDIASKSVLLDAVLDTAGRGTAVLVISDNIDDLRICDRVLVMFAGRPVAVLPAGFGDDTLIAAMEGIIPS